MKTWHIYGYGICTDKINIDSVEKLEKLLSYAPKYQSEIHDYFNACKITEPTIEDYEEYDEDYYLGITTILKEVIKEAEDVNLIACDNFECEHFLIYGALYPWQMSDKDKEMTEEKLNAIFHKYVSILTDTPIDIGYESPENGG